MNMSIIDRHQSPVTWATQTHNRHPVLQQLLQSSSPAPAGSGAHTPNIAAVTSNAQSRHYYGSPFASNARPPSTSVYDISIPPKNERELSRDVLKSILNYFSQLVPQHFGRPIRLVVHGGACMLLHEGLYKLSVQQQQMSPHLPRRTTTRDVDYIHRSFVTEMTSLGVPDAASRLLECVKSVAREFKLGLDWMNSDADVALPYAYDPQGKMWDPIYHASVQPNNIDLHTIYTSANGMLKLISVTPFWAVSLKLVRYVKWDPGDICLLLRNGVVLSGVNWTPDELETWLYTNCWAMGYAHFDSIKKQQMRERILDALDQLKKWNEAVGIGEYSPQSRGSRKERGGDRSRNSSDKERDAMYTSWMSNTAAGGHGTVSAHDAMGGGEVIGGGADTARSSGWTWGWEGGKSWPAGKKRSNLDLNGKERERQRDVQVIAKSPPPNGRQVPAIPGPANPAASSGGSWGSSWTSPPPAGYVNVSNGVQQRAMHLGEWADGGNRSSGSGSGSDKERRMKEQQGRSKSRSSGRKSGEVDFNTVPYIPTDVIGHQRRSSGEEKDNRGRAGRRSPSKARRSSPSQVRSRSRSIGGIFVPDSDEEEEAGNYASRYAPPTRQGSTQPYQSQQRPWVPVNPNHAPNASRHQSPEPSRTAYNGIYTVPPIPTDSRASMRSPVGASGRRSAQPAALDYDSHLSFSELHYQKQQQPRTPHGQVSHVGQSGHASGRHSPMPDASARYAQTEKTRQKKEKAKRRTKSLVRARDRKWVPDTRAHSGTDDSSDEVDSGMESDSGLGESESEDERDDKERGRAGIRGWGSAMMGWARSGKRDPGASQTGAPSLAPPIRSTFALASHPATRVVSRNPSPNPMTEKKSRSASRSRPPPLDLPSPPPVASQQSNGNHAQGRHRGSQPVAQANDLTATFGLSPPGVPDTAPSLGPAERAQFQFEQQQRDYQRQLALQSHHPTVQQVAQQVAERVQAQSQDVQHPHQQRAAPTGSHPHHHQMQPQHPHSWYGQQPQGQQGHQQQQAHALRGHASWAAPSHGSGPSAQWGQPQQHQQQGWYQQQQQQPQRHARGLRPSHTEIYR